MLLVLGLCMACTLWAGALTAAAAEPILPVEGEEIQTVHTIYWKCKMTSSYKGLSKGKTVTVVYRSYASGGRSHVLTDDGSVVRVPNRCLNFVADLCTGAEGDYNVSTKLNFVNNKKHLSSRTNFLIWVCLDKQRVNVFQGSMDNWQLIRVMKCSSGLPSSPSRAGLHKCDFKALWFRGCNYYVEYGGSGIHKWAYSDYKDLHKIGKHTASQSCVRLKPGDAKWLYKHTPVKTTILLY